MLFRVFPCFPAIGDDLVVDDALQRGLIASPLCEDDIEYLALDPTATCSVGRFASFDAAGSTL